MPAQTNNADRPMVFHGSEGMMMTTYKRGKSQTGLAFILRDQIKTLQDSAPGRHIVLGMDGTCDLTTGTYTVHKILAAHFQRHAVMGNESLPVTRPNAEKILFALALSMQQMQGGNRLRARENLEKAEKMQPGDLETLLERLYPAQNLDISPSNP